MVPRVCLPLVGGVGRVWVAARDRVAALRRERRDEARLAEVDVEWPALSRGHIKRPVRLILPHDGRRHLARRAEQPGGQQAGVRAHNLGRALWQLRQ